MSTCHSESRERLGRPVLGFALLALIVALPGRSAAVDSVAATSWTCTATGKMKRLAVPEGGRSRRKDRLRIGFVIDFRADGSFVLGNTAGERFVEGTWSQKRTRVVLEAASVLRPEEPASGILGGIPDDPLNVGLDPVRWKLVARLRKVRGEGATLAFRYALVTYVDGAAPARIAAKFRGVGVRGDAGPEGNSVTLTWRKPKRNEDHSKLTDLAGYRVHFGKVGGTEEIDIVGPDVTTHTVYDLDSACVYWFRLTAVDAAGNESDPSEEVYGSFP